MVQEVKDATGNKISHVLDAVFGSDTQFTSVKILVEDKPGKTFGYHQPPQSQHATKDGWRYRLS